MRAARAMLVVLGVAVIAIGGLVLVMDVPLGRWGGILLWFVGALVIHDGIVAPAVFGVSLVMRRAGRRIPWGVLLIVQGALVVAAIMTAVVVPEILKQRIGSANPSILPLPYLANLGGFYAGLAVVTALAAAIYLRVRRQKVRPPSSQR